MSVWVCHISECFLASAVSACRFLFYFICFFLFLFFFATGGSGSRHFDWTAYCELASSPADGVLFSERPFDGKPYRDTVFSRKRPYCRRSEQELNFLVLAERSSRKALKTRKWWAVATREHFRKEAQTQTSLSRSLWHRKIEGKIQTPPRDTWDGPFFSDLGCLPLWKQLQGSHYEARCWSARRTTVRAVQNELSPETNTKAITQEGYSSCLPTLFIIHAQAFQKLSTAGTAS